jgi:methylmalonyl-CoA/ethylmalonyl-CoA epimerase
LGRRGVLLATTGIATGHFLDLVAVSTLDNNIPRIGASMDDNTKNGTTKAQSPADARPCQYHNIDHIAIAVVDLESAVAFFSEVLGFTLMKRLQIKGVRTGMNSAEMECRGIKFVLCQGTEPDSQVSRLIRECGPGVAHIALAVDDVETTVAELRDRGMDFDTTVIKGPGLIQAFSSRSKNSGLSFEFIQRGSEENFSEANVQELFNQMERSGSY